MADPGSVVTSLAEAAIHALKPSFEEVRLDLSQYVLRAQADTLAPGDIEGLELDKSDDDFLSHFGHCAQAGDATSRIVSLSHPVTYSVRVGNW